MKNKSVLFMAQAAMIAAIYVVLTIVFAPFSSEIRKLTSCISDVVSFYWVSDFYRADSFVLEICSICKFNVNTHFYFSLPDGSQVLSM